MSQTDAGLLWNACLGVLWTAGTSAAVLALARLRARPGTPLRAAAPGLAIGLGFAAGYATIQGPPPLSFELTIRQWLFYAGLALALFGLYEAHAGRPKVLARALLAALLPLLLLEFQREHHWGRTEGMLWSAALAGLVFASWQCAGAREERDPRGSRTLALAFALALAAGAYGLSGSLLIAELGGALAVSVGLCALFELLRGQARTAAGLGSASVGVLLALHHGLLWCARFLSELSWTSFGLLALVPLVAWLPRSRTRLSGALVGLAPVLLAGLALVLEARDQAEPYE